jgi:co-chaperonin GroES (HSP10)
MESALNNFLVVQKEKIKEEKSSGGIIINVSNQFDFKDTFSKKNVCYAHVIHANPDISFLKVGDKIAMNPNKGTRAAMDFEEYTIITKDQFIAKIEKDGRFVVPPNCVMIKIKKEDTESLYSKWITRDDGTKAQLFIQPEPDKDSDKRSTIYVSFGEVVQTGENVNGVNEGDIAILDYTVDNDMDNILYFDEDKNKYIVIAGNTTFHDGDKWAYGNRINPRDTLVAKSGEMDIISPLLGMIRAGKLIARRPYVFINHEDTKVSRETISGIIYSEDQFVMKRNVLSVSEESTRSFGMKEGQNIVVEDFDIFDIKLPNKDFIQCILDRDILMGVNDNTGIA